MAEKKQVKVKLGARPKSFTRPVSFPMLDENGKPAVGCIEVSYRYRTRREFAGFVDDVKATVQTQADDYTAKVKAQLEKDGTVPIPTQKELLEAGLENSVDFVMGAIDGWNLEEKFERKAVDQLADELPAAIKAIMEDYNAAINEGRLGN